MQARLPRFRLPAWWKSALLYGALLAAGTGVLAWLDYQRLVRSHVAEVYDFLLAGDVFTKDQLEGYIALKWEEVYAFEHTPHPVEYQMYYSC